MARSLLLIVERYGDMDGRDATYWRSNDYANIYFGISNNHHVETKGESVQGLGGYSAAVMMTCSVLGEKTI